MTALTIMVQGTASHVGKSLLGTALCRIFAQDGLRVAPFKSQNMANNSHVCRDGGEIGRAQAVQAMACGIEPTVDMNPILLKPAAELGAQVVVRGRAIGTFSTKEYQALQPAMLDTMRDSLATLRAIYDVIVIEGAGSTAEVNLMDHDIANMKTAAIADAPVLLVANIDWGGVFAQIIGTMDLLPESDRARVRGLVINKFRGDPEYFRSGIAFLERETARPVLGVLPYFRNVQLPEEDSLPEEKTRSLPAHGKIRIDVVYHPGISNFTDFDALEAEPDVCLRYVRRPDTTLPDAILLPGTKSTIADLRRLRESGMAEYVLQCAQKGAGVVGICGGLQMMGTRIVDPDHTESQTGSAEGLGLLPLTTTFSGEKETGRIIAIHPESGQVVSGYEIHMGRSETGADARPMFHLTERHGQPCEVPEGASAFDGRVWGSYIHGLFDNAGFRRWFLDRLRAAHGWPPLNDAALYDPGAEIDKLAAAARTHLDMQNIYSILRRESP